MIISKYAVLGSQNDANDRSNQPEGLEKARKSDEVCKYVAIGESGSWYYHYHVSGKCHTSKLTSYLMVRSQLIWKLGWSKNLKSKYPSLVKWLGKKKAFGCPIQVTLGLGTQYHIKMKNGLRDYYLLPDILKRVGSSNDVSRVWFGCGYTWVMEMEDGRWKWHLDGKYGSLNDHIREFDEIKVLHLGH